MKKGSKVAIAIASVGGTMMMVVPMALAGTYDPTGATLTGATSSQWQTGCGASGTTLDQNSNISTGQLQAQSYYSDTTSSGGNSNSQQYVVNEGKQSTASTTSSVSDGGNSWTKASNYNTAGSTVTQNQSQLITSGSEGDMASGGMQAQHAMAGTANVNQDWTLSGGLAGNHQFQNGQGSNQSVLNQTANVQTGTTTANSYKYDVNNSPSSSNNQQYTGGKLTTNTSTYNAGGSSYTKASNYSNPTAGVSQDQSQVIGLDGNGASTQKQTSWAVSGSATDQFWQSIY